VTSTTDDSPAALSEYRSGARLRQSPTAIISSTYFLRNVSPINSQKSQSQYRQKASQTNYAAYSTATKVPLSFYEILFVCSVEPNTDHTRHPKKIPIFTRVRVQHGKSCVLTFLFLSKLVRERYTTLYFDADHSSRIHVQNSD
jgi:hypothetical protein